MSLEGRVTPERTNPRNERLITTSSRDPAKWGGEPRRFLILVVVGVRLRILTMDIVVDFECLYGVSGSCVVKELALFPTFGAGGVSITFQPPSSWEDLPMESRRENIWISKHMNYLHWSDGSEPYSNLVPFFEASTSSGDKLYVNGMKKVEFLTALLDRPIYDLVEMGCPKLSELSQRYTVCCNPELCGRHRVGRHCAVKKCLAYAAWMRNHGPF